MEEKKKMETQIHEGKSKEYKYIELPKAKYGLLLGPLEEGIVQVGLDAFGAGMTKEEILEHILPTDLLQIAYNKQGITGFATALFKKETIDLVGAAVKREAQGSGIYSHFSLRRINFGLNRGRNKVQLRTQNPKVELGVRLCLDSLVEVGLISDYQVNRELRRGLYGRMLTAVQPSCGIERIDSTYASLQYQRGDAFALEFTLGVRK